MDYSWEELTSCKFSPSFQNILIVTTPLKVETIRELWNKFIEQEVTDANFDEFITRETGVPAISSVFEDTEETFFN